MTKISFLSFVQNAEQSECCSHNQTDVRCVLSFISRGIKDSSLLRYADSSLGRTELFGAHTLLLFSISRISSAGQLMGKCYAGNLRERFVLKCRMRFFGVRSVQVR
jgi:hypothetical protein